MRPVPILIGLMGCTMLFILANVRWAYPDASETTTPTPTWSPVSPAETKLRSYWIREGAYDELFASLRTPSVPMDEPVAGAIVNHHLLSSTTIADTLYALRDRRPSVVVIVSPNHFGTGADALTTSASHWWTMSGTMRGNPELVAALMRNDAFGSDDDVIQGEHGVTNVISFVRSVWPETTVVPLVVRESISAEESDRLAAFLDARLPEDALVVGSFDFSHLLPDAVADFHDAQAIAVLEQLDPDTSRVEVDARSGLRMLIQYVRMRGATTFSLTHHTSAAEITGETETDENTSYLTGYYTIGTPPKPTVTLLDVGDLFFDRYVRQTMDREGSEYVFASLERFFQGIDVVTGNLEGPITTSAPRPLDPNNLVFTFDPVVADVLDAHAFTAVSLGNNHTLNYGKTGIDETRKILDAHGIRHFGSQNNAGALSTIQTVRGIRVGLIGVNTLGTTDATLVTDEITRLEPETDFLVVIPHWGSEYQTMSVSSSQRTIGHRFIDAGADIVLGSHPHVIQPLEQYGGGIIAYSLGNFLFDQYAPGTQDGLAVGLVIGPTELGIHLFPVHTERFQVQLQSGGARETLLSELAANSDVEEGVRAQLATGSISVPRR